MDKIPFRIIEIVTENFRVLPDNEIEDSVGIEISTGHSFAVNIPEHRVRCYSNYTYKQQDKEILVLDLICTFDVEEESFTSFKKNNKLILDVQYLQYLASISVGVARGEIHARSEMNDSKISKIVLPPVNLVKSITEPTIFDIIDSN
jgi:hypothetical protein